MTSSCQPSNDNVFGPIVKGCRSGFDFTLLFEQTILSIGPAALLLLSTPPRLVSLLRATRKTIFTHIRSVKIVVALALVAVQLGLLIAWGPTPSTKATLPSLTLSFLSALAVLVISILEHSRAVQPSSILNVYLLVALAFDAVQARTLYLRHEKGVILGLFTSNIGLKAILLFLECRSKKSFLRAQYEDYPPEATSGIYNRSFFWWLNPTLASGFRRLITLDDLFKGDNELLSRPVQDIAEKNWQKYRSAGRMSLVYAMFHCMRKPLAYMVFPRLCLIGFNYAQPFLITAAVAYVSQPVVDQNKNDGYGLIGAAGIIYVGIALTTANYQHQMNRATTIFRGSMITLIYSKTLDIQAGVYDESSALTLMSTDLDRLTLSIESVCEIWANFIEMVIGLWLLQRQLGWVCFAPIVIVMASIYASSIVSRKIGPRQRQWVKAIQRRVAMTSSMLGSMKSAKMMGLADILFQSLQGQRVRELDLSKKFRQMVLWRLLLSFIPTILSPLSCFVIFAIQASVNGSGHIDSSQTFSALAIISLLTTPASSFLQSLPQIAMATGCLSRVHAFLLSESRRDDRIIYNASSSTEKFEKTIGDMELTSLPNDSSSLKFPVVIAQNLTVRPAKEAPIVLNDLNFQMDQGSLTMLVGVVGSGKSTLLRCLLGELKFEQGSITVTTKSTAYCSQTSWLPNATVSQIICGNSISNDSEWYNTVLHACAFDQDVLQLPNGNDTLIGSRGVTLSGGQKQRLALARTVYARRSLIVLDDILSAIDAKTEELIVDRLLGKNGLFKRLGSTVIIATHAIRRLPLSDQIIVLGADGKIIEKGNYDELKSQGGFVHKVMLHPDLLQSDSRGNQLERDASQKPSAAAKVLKGPSATDVQDLTRRLGDVTVYKYYLQSIGWKVVLFNAICGILWTLSGNFPRLWLAWYADGTVSSLALFACIFALSAVIGILALTTLLYTLYAYIVIKSGLSLHKKLLQSVIGAPQSYFDETDSGVTLNRFSQDMTLIDGQLPAALVLAFSSLLQCIAQVGFIATGSAYMGITIIPLLLAVYTLQMYYLRTSRQMRYLDLENKSPLYTQFAETLEGLSTIRAFGWEKTSTDANLARLDNSQRPYYMLFCIQRWLNIVLQLLIAGMVVILVALATSLTRTTSGARLGISLSAVVQFNSNLATLLKFWTQLETSLGAVARTKSFEEGTISEYKPQETVVPPEAWPSSGEIQLKNVTASYSGVPALENISFSIKAGEKIGICGRTGSGKSSLLSVLLRILDIDSGSLIIDGQDLELVKREAIRSRFITIPQDPFILSGSVRLNIDPSGTAAEEAMIAVLMRVDLWDILKSRGGLDADMNSNPLSQGQQQIFCLARAMLRIGKGKILVLDEATSSVDADTDFLMQKLIREEFKDCTVLTVAHRLDTIMDSDRILVLDAGRVVELGSPQELLENRGHFWGLSGSRH